MEPELINNTMPSKESLENLFEGFNAALLKFEESNPKVPRSTILGTAFQTMLSYPYSWMKSAGTTEKFVEVVTSEANHMAALVALSQQAESVVNKE